MKLIFIVMAGIMATAAPVFAEEPAYVNYKIKLDRDWETNKARCGCLQYDSK